jgi:hypothetical protein
MRARAGRQHSECRVRESRSRESRRSIVEGLSPLRNEVEESPFVVSVDIFLIHLHPVVPLRPNTTCFSFSCNPLSGTSTVQCKGGLHIVIVRSRSGIDGALSNPFAIQNGGISNLSTVVQRHRYYRTIGDPRQVVRASLRDLPYTLRSHWRADTNRRKCCRPQGTRDPTPSIPRRFGWVPVRGSTRLTYIA